MPPRRDDVAQLLAHYPRVYFACHRRHVRDERTGALLSAHQASILDHLDAVDPTTLTALAQHMGVTPGTTSVAVDRLVRGGYVTRAVDETDRRRVQLRLSEAGARIKSASSVLDPDLVRAMLAQLGDDERADALRGLALLARAADALRAAAPRDRSRST